MDFLNGEALNGPASLRAELGLRFLVHVLFLVNVQVLAEMFLVKDRLD